MEAKRNKILLYINNNKVNFSFKYEVKELKEIKVKFKFNKKLIKNTSYMFYECGSLESIDLSSFNTSNVRDMDSMFEGCFSIGSIDLSSFNINNIKNMNCMFSRCIFLKSIDLNININL